MRVIIRGNWAPYLGTDYCYALGVYDSLTSASDGAEQMAYDNWEGPDEDDDSEDEGPEYWTEEYDPDKHDMQRACGGSFASDFEAMEGN